MLNIQVLYIESICLWNSEYSLDICSRLVVPRGRKRRIESIARVVGFDGVGYQLADWGADALDTLVEAEDRISDALNSDQLEELDDGSLDPFSYVDPAIIDVLAALGEE